MIKSLFHVKNVGNNIQSTCLKCTYGLYGQNYRVATLFTFGLNVSEIIIPSLKSIGHYDMPKLKDKNRLVLIIELLRLLNGTKLEKD